MASGTLGVNDSNSRETHRWGNGNNKVYTRKFHTKGIKNTAAVTSKATPTCGSIPANNGNSNCENKPEAATATTSNCDESNENTNEDRRSKNDNNNVKDVSDNHQSERTLATEEATSSNGKELANGNEVLKPVLTSIGDRVRIDLQSAKSKDELKELKRTLVSDLDQVRTLLNKLEAKELELTALSNATVAGDAGYSHSQSSASDVRDRGGSLQANSELNEALKPTCSGATVAAGGYSYSQSQYSGNDARDRGSMRVISDANEVLKPTYSNPIVATGGGYSQSQYSANDVRERGGLMRANSDVGSGGHRDSRPFRKLNVSVMDNNRRIGGGVEFVEKEKRTPKANQYYRNSEFLLAKDRLPPESHTKLKPNSGKKHGGDMRYGFGGVDKYRIEVFRNCSNLLQRLMKHKFGWVFNETVNVKALGLHDYYDIIKNPMDLGTIKNRLAQNYYKSPREFAEDVRLTFHNAMTYNPKGHDVHIMAEELMNMFEVKWKVIEAEYQPEWRFQMYHDVGLVLTTPTSRKVPSLHLPAQTALPMRTLERSESMTAPVDPKMRASSFAHVGRTLVPKKPKAKDANKRDMTYEEKQKLSSNLQNLPSEKLDNIVLIIKKRNSALSHHDDEIEVDIDRVDAETLWELDRFVSNYKKSLSKNKRKAEIALQARAEAGHPILTPNPATANVEVLKENKTDEVNISNSPVQGEKQVFNASRSSSSSSSSSDSGSSSSDTDSDSSSADGSDAENSVRT